MSKKRTDLPKCRLDQGRLKPYGEVRQELLADPEVALEYDRLKIKREAAETLARARKKKGMTQQEVAERAGTTQSAIARLESARGGIPSLALLDRVARALGLALALQFRPVG